MKKVIQEFDRYLEAHNLAFEGTIIGGAALLVLGVSSRQTKVKGGVK